jgi:hypothetical protein
VLRVMRVIVHHCKELWCGKNGDLELQRRWRKTLNPKIQVGTEEERWKRSGKERGREKKINYKRRRFNMKSNILVTFVFLFFMGIFFFW